jgi:hypothetical protein
MKLAAAPTNPLFLEFTWFVQCAPFRTRGAV